MSTITGFDEKSNGWTKSIVQRLGGVARADAFLRGELAVCEKSPRLLFVDRSIKATYPDWMKEVLHPELEMTGPTHLDPVCAPLYFHPKQKNGGVIEGNKLYAFLKETGLIEHSLSLRDGEELQKNPQLFPEAWKGKYVFLWKSVVQRRDGNLLVPFVCWLDGQVFLDWRWLGLGWYGDSNPAALSAS